MNVARQPGPNQAPPAPFTELDARRLGRIRRYFALHPVAMDWVVVGIYGIASLTAAVENPHRRLGLVLILAGGAALLWRRRYPVWTAAAVGVLSAATIFAIRDPLGFNVAITFAVYSVAAARRPAIAWATMIALLVAFGTNALLWMSSGTISGRGTFTEPDGQVTTLSPATAGIVTLIMTSLGAMAIGNNVRARRTHVAALVERANALARDREQHAALAAATERTRIAREMHDVVAHSLTVMVALADGAKAAFAKHPELAVQALDELTTTGRSALTDMRRVLGALREPSLAGGGAPLAPADAVEPLEDLVERFRTAGLPVRFTRAGHAADLPLAVRATVQRIVQESLTNVLRYAPHSPLVTVELSRRDESRRPGESGHLVELGRPVEPIPNGDWLDIRVTNLADPSGERAVRAERAERDGTPPASIGTGRGIIGMRERAALYGGTVVAGPTATGWQVRATLHISGDQPGAPPHRPAT